jgi:hypothetical protein
MMRESLLADVVRTLVGKPCTEVYGGITVGAWLTILLGRTWRVPSGSGLEAEMAVELEAAQWKLFSGDKILCSSASEIGYESEMHRGLRQLIGKEVVSAEVDTLTCNLLLRFQDHLSFLVECAVFPDPEDDNYSVKVIEKRYTINSELHLVVEEARPS